MGSLRLEYVPKGHKDAFTKNCPIQAWLWRMDRRETNRREKLLNQTQRREHVWYQLPASFQGSILQLPQLRTQNFLVLFCKG